MTVSFFSILASTFLNGQRQWLLINKLISKCNLLLQSLWSQFQLKQSLASYLMYVNEMTYTFSNSGGADSSKVIRSILNEAVNNMPSYSMNEAAWWQIDNCKWVRVVCEAINPLFLRSALSHAGVTGGGFPALASPPRPGPQHQPCSSSVATIIRTCSLT